MAQEVSQDEDTLRRCHEGEQQPVRRRAETRRLVQEVAGAERVSS